MGIHISIIITISFKIYISCKMFSINPLVWKSFSHRKSAITGCGQSLGLCCVKIRKVRGRKCVPVAYIIAIPSGLLTLHSSILLCPQFFLFSHSLSAPTLPPEDSLFRALSTHNHAFACKLDITT